MKTIIVDGKKYVPAEDDSTDIRIVILQRGWVVVGRYSQKGTQCFIDGGSVIRRWGTSKGLGQLASEGPLTDTKLESTDNIQFHELVVVASISCDSDKWTNHVR